MTVVLCGIEYRVALPDVWTAVFTATAPIGNRPVRFMLYRAHGGLWAFQPVDGYGDVACAHIAAAYLWAIKNIGGDHDISPRKPEEYANGHDVTQ